MTLKTDWHLLSPEEVAERFGTDPASGLTTEQARTVGTQYGPNELVEAPGATLLDLIWSQLKNVLVLMLIGAAIVALAIGEVRSALAIAVIVAFNTVLGVWQESRKSDGRPQAHGGAHRAGAPQCADRRDTCPRSCPWRCHCARSGQHHSR
jgi:magnesium-transporting ATPase (P-type)